MTQKYLDDLTYEIIGAAIEVHKIMGKGFLEIAYHFCLQEELSLRNINFKSELKVPLVYKGKTLEADFRRDLYIENAIVVELKATNEIHPIFEAQLINNMKLLKAQKEFY